jgi:phospholipase C
VPVRHARVAEKAQNLQMSPTRREFMVGALGAAAAATTVGRAAADALTAAPTPLALPDPARSGIDHIVVLMMENRSFDHFLGWLPGADGRQEGLTFLDDDGTAYSTHHLTDFQGCAHPDPDHSFNGGRTQLDWGACDGFLRGRNDDYAIGYYTADDLPFTGPAAQYWCTFDRYFAATMSSTFPNRFYQHTAATDRISNTYDPTTLPTIWQRLRGHGITAHYYYVDAPFIALFGGQYVKIARPFDTFLDNCAQGKLPAVSFVDPKFLDEGGGTSADDHPHADIRAGQYFLNQVYEAVTSGPQWDRTALVINYDEWGGFFDHVIPTTAPDKRPDLRTGLRGFRVPCLLISPRVRRGTIGHQVYDHTSILKMIEWRFGLPALSRRDHAARNLAEVLDFGHAPDLTAPRWDVPAVVSQACELSEAEALDEADGYADWRRVREIADRLGFPASVGASF